MKVLVINAGSSSCKYQLLEMDNESVLASGLAERIGQGMGCLTHKIAPDTDKAEKIVKEAAFPTHVEAMELVISLLTDPEKGVIKDKSEIFAIGHRVLHGGEDITRTVKVDGNVKKIIRDNFLLGPLHNPANLMGIEVAEKLFPGVPNVAVFDTEFGMGMPKEAYMYGLPYELYEELKIRRYGFHGTSHKYIAKKTAEYLGKPQSELRSITMHLGNPRQRLFHELREKRRLLRHQHGPDASGRPDHGYPLRFHRPGHRALCHGKEGSYPR